MPDNDVHRYDDIIDLPHHQSAVHPHMSAIDRAAQFSPFAALTGYDDAIAETARLTDAKLVLSDEQMESLNETLTALEKLLPQRPVVKVVYFVPDTKKAGGTYVTKAGQLRRIDTVGKVISFMDGSNIQMPDILDIMMGTTETVQ